MPTKKRRVGFIPRSDVLDLINENQIKIKNNDKDFANKFYNITNTDNTPLKESSDEFIDKEIYAKFLMFLQFQEKMKKRN